MKRSIGTAYSKQKRLVFDEWQQALWKVITPVPETIWQSPSAWNESVLVSLWEHTWQLQSKLSRGLVKEMKLGFTYINAK